ncbi:MAG: hypothetical protein DCF25_09055 [Leptolyngbya foveolarum]|uniref:Uncharacterized protein n=1 Tax=Leptolyngbya foveolarum TaxID=47253 RepID=A0A2W4UEM9_9CYAN|nr:MAG: hypothetical protein DCF25_09055 [Leptolyngbya foveolarum]
MEFRLITAISDKVYYFRIRVGNYRVVYSANDKVLMVVVIRVGHRSEVYKNL